MYLGKSRIYQFFNNYSFLNLHLFNSLMYLSHNIVNNYNSYIYLKLLRYYNEVYTEDRYHTVVVNFNLRHHNPKINYGLTYTKTW